MTASIFHEYARATQQSAQSDIGVLATSQAFSRRIQYTNHDSKSMARCAWFELRTCVLSDCSECTLYIEIAPALLLLGWADRRPDESTAAARLLQDRRRVPGHEDPGSAVQGAQGGSTESSHRA